MQGRALLIRQAQEGGLQLLKPDLAVLGGRNCRLGHVGSLLEAAGLVTRSPSADDERGVTVTITGPGRALLAAVLPGHIEVLSRQLFTPLSAADTQALADLLAPVRDHMRSQPPRSAAPRRRR